MFLEYASHAVAPISVTLARIAALDEFMVSEVGVLEAGWIKASELADPTLPYLQQELDRPQISYPTIEDQTKGSFFIGEYSWSLAAAAIGAYLAEGRVPDLAADNMAVRFRTETVEDHGETFEVERIDIRFLSEQGAALAAAPSMLVVPDLPALREWLRTQMEAHLTPLIKRISALTKLGQRAQWSLVADSCAGAFLHAGKLLEAEDRALVEGMAFVKAAGSPMNNPLTGYVTVEANGCSGTFRLRGGCCRYYTLPDVDKCSSCVLRPIEDQHQRLINYLIKSHQPEEIVA